MSICGAAQPGSSQSDMSTTTWRGVSTPTEAHRAEKEVLSETASITSLGGKGTA